jgi:pimeloyl-ACP methyl ester carboxylesterase
MPYAENGGVRVYYEVEGEGQPLVLHAGFMQRLQDWRREDVAVAQVLRDDYRLILMDPRGHGRSDKPHDAAAYHVETRVRDITAVLDAEGINRAHYWGYSMGGGAGFGLGIYAPDRVRSLILGGTSPYATDRPDNAGVVAELRQGTMEDFVAAMEARVGSPLPPEARAGWLANDPLALAASADASATQPDLGARIAEITAPTLIYAGDQDAPFAGARRAAEAIPGATFVALSGLNHALAFRTREAILPHVRAFLARVG